MSSSDLPVISIWSKSGLLSFQSRFTHQIILPLFSELISGGEDRRLKDRRIKTED